MEREPIICLVAILASAFRLTSVSGAAFDNFDFEASSIPVDSPVSFPPDPVSTSLLFPSWTLRYGESIQTTAWFNTYYLAGANAALMASSVPNTSVLQGTRSLYINGWASPMSIAQIGDVPAGTQSIRFLARTISMPDPILTMDGQNIPLVKLSESGGVFTFGGDISNWAGINSELRITAAGFGDNPGLGSFNLDAVQFSPVPIPEPASLMLLGTAAATLLDRRRR